MPIRVSPERVNAAVATVIILAVIAALALITYVTGLWGAFAQLAQAEAEHLDYQRNLHDAALERVDDVAGLDRAIQEATGQHRSDLAARRYILIGETCLFIGQIDSQNDPDLRKFETFECP